MQRGFYEVVWHAPNRVLSEKLCLGDHGDKFEVDLFWYFLDAKLMFYKLLTEDILLFVK